jgi:hypothetical protein
MLVPFPAPRVLQEVLREKIRPVRGSPAMARVVRYRCLQTVRGSPAMARVVRYRCLQTVRHWVLPDWSREQGWRRMALLPCLAPLRSPLSQ